MAKLYKTQHPKEHAKQQHCLICNRYVKYDERYQNYVCKKCALLITDKAGKRYCSQDLPIIKKGKIIWFDDAQDNFFKLAFEP